MNVQCDSSAPPEFPTSAFFCDPRNRFGDIYLTHTMLNGKFTLRLRIGQTQTAARHLVRAWNLIQAASQSQS